MWSESDSELQEDRMGRSSAGSEVVMIDERAIAAASRTAPNVSNLNVTKSTRVHIGPRFVSVTQNVHNSEVVKDLPFHQYIWNIAQNSTKAERLLCGIAISALFISIALILFFTVTSTEETDPVDIAPHEWNITREMWLAQRPNSTDSLDKFIPLRLVVVQHTVSQECKQFHVCAAELRNLQSYFNNKYHYDIPYNFLIGNEGRVYEGRGWNVVGAHTYKYNRCSLGLGFIGDYREEIASHAKVTDLQLQRTKMLLEEGLRLGILHPDYYILGAKDLQETASPGSNLYNAIQNFEHYDHKAIYRNKTCEEIFAMYTNVTDRI